MSALSPDHTHLLTVVFSETYGTLLEDFAEKVSDPTHAWYGRYMSREELATYVRPKEDAVFRVHQWLGAAGITPAETQPLNNQVAFFKATRQSIELAFGTRAARWLDPGKESRAQRRQWPIPNEIGGLVQHIQVIRGTDQSLEWLEGTYWLQEDARGVDATAHLEKPPALGGMSPADIAEIYGLPAEFTGAGETIAVLMLGHAPDEADTARFWADQGIERAPFQVVHVGPKAQRDPSALGALEAAMVVQWAGAMAPDAAVVVYVVDETIVADPWTAFLMAVVGDTELRPTIACTSWLLPERTYYNAHGPGLISGLLNQCAALGVTVLSATGDWGCFDSFPRTRNSQAETVADAPWPHAVFPAVEDKVLAVGGTMISQKAPLTELAWSGPLPISLYGRLAFTRFAGGGGFSMEVPIPEWQRPFVTMLPNMVDKKAFGRGPDTPAVLAYGRGIPDVALMSTSRAVLSDIPERQRSAFGKAQDLTTEGYQALVQGQWIDYAGGTSMAAPIWAAIVARINQARAAAARAAQATLGPALETRMIELADSPDVSIRPGREPYAMPEDVPAAHPALRRPLGFCNPLLYRVEYEEANVQGTRQPLPPPERAFRDITTGNTDVTVRTLQRNHEGSFKAFLRTIPGYEADEGWDPVTGLGVPRVDRLLARLVEPQHLGLEPAPAQDYRGTLGALFPT